MNSKRGRGGMLMAGIAAGAVALGLFSGQSSMAASADSPPASDAVQLNGADAGRLVAKPEIRTATRKAGRSTYLLKLDPAPATRVFYRNRSEGLFAAKSAARAQLTRIAGVQADVARSLPANTPVVYRTHSVISGLAVQSSTANADALEGIPGVAAVYPVAPKQLDNSHAVPLQGADAAWNSFGGITGEGVKIAVVDSGIDYTHADFGGEGTVEAYETAHENEAEEPEASVFPNAKVIGGYDFVGDTYQPDEDLDDFQPDAIPDDNPLDCGGHGSHVAGTAAGFGVTAGGTTYTGDYDESTDFGAMRIGPGMAPEATLLAYKVFGCEGSSSWITAAIDMAADPNGDGNPNDGADVINLSVGSDFGSAEDGDSVAANAAVDLGVSVAASAGNAGDRTDISGSPGNASKVITAANSQDAASRIDGTTIAIDGTPDNYGSSRSVEYHWSTGPDLAGDVIRAPETNRTACDPYPDDTFSGEVVMVEWTDDNLECGSVQRSGNLADAGAGGFIFASNGKTVTAGITGSASIPGVLIVKAAADEIRDAVDADQEVVVQGTTVNSFTQDFPEDDDKVAASSSRGIHAAGNVKPDVAAVGTSVFSAGVGTGGEGVSESGTSMSSPMVAGLAALVRSANPTWTPLQVKADIMNTANHDISVNGADGPAGDIFAPVRVGAGRIDADQAVNNDVLAYNPEGGTVSVSFGPVEASGPVTLTKDITVQNTGGSAVTYDTSYEAVTSVPGVEYSVSPSQVTVAAGGSQTVTVTLEVTDVEDLTKTVDPTVGRESVALESPRETLAEASGRVLLEPTSSAPTLRVPVYAAPRPASTMDQADSLEISGGQEQTADFELNGSDLGEGGANGTGNADPDDDIFSIAAGFELTATSGLSPECSEEVDDICVRLPEERGADLRNVGFTSSYPYSSTEASRGYFALSAHAPFSVPADKITFQVDIDVDGDREADLFLLNTRLVQGQQSEDVFVAALFDTEDNTVDIRGMNGRFGDLDTALYDTDTIVLPFATQALEEFGIDPDNPTINYGVLTYSAYSNQLIDMVGINPQSGDVQLSANLFEPGIQVRDANGNGPLLNDIDGEELSVTRDIASYREDDGKGLMMVHFHNKNGDKSQVVDLHGKPQAITITSTPASPTVGDTYQPTAIGGGSGNQVTFRSTTGGICTVAGGIVSFVGVGGCRIVADQAGNDDYEPASPVSQSFEITKGAGPSIAAAISSSTPKNARGWFRTPVTVTFACTPGRAQLAGACPAPVNLSSDGADQSVSGSIAAADGATSTATVGDIDIDRTKPTVKIRGIRKGKKYRKAPKGRCVATDKLSKVASCKLKKKRKGKKVTYTAKATDKAGNARTLTVRVRIKR